MTEPEAHTARRASILDAAAGVFLRYGFKKTSMDDLARAAGLSRQGLYLSFATKEILFKEAVLRLITSMRAGGKAALAREDLSVEERLLGAFECVHAQAIGQVGYEHMPELLETARELLGGVALEVEQGLVAEIAKVLKTSGIASHWKDAEVSAKELAETLSAASIGIKHSVTSVAEYRERMRRAVKLVCRGGAGPST